ncbi:MAG: hypothetical protein M0C28_00885 [Candidatus Moduliflexus flocculans]|nr:hypothetical protein [Candidatus Moduliflexus flocculans]
MAVGARAGPAERDRARLVGMVTDPERRSAARRRGIEATEPEDGRQGDRRDGRRRHLPSVLPAFRYVYEVIFSLQGFKTLIRKDIIVQLVTRRSR